MDKSLASSENNMWNDDFYRIQWAGDDMIELNFRFTYSSPCPLHSILGLQNIPAPYFSTEMSACCHLLRSFNLSLKNHHRLGIKPYEPFSSEPKRLACDLKAQVADVENFSENTERQNRDWHRFPFNCFKPSAKAGPAKELHQTIKNQHILITWLPRIGILLNF